MAEHSESICRGCFHSYVCEQFNEHRESDNKKCHFFNDHFVPAADVVEVRHGEWVYPSYAPYGGSYLMKHCSLCEYEPVYAEGVIYEPYSQYCPNCGARMDGKADG